MATGGWTLWLVRNACAVQGRGVAAVPGVVYLDNAVRVGGLEARASSCVPLSLVTPADRCPESAVPWRLGPCAAVHACVRVCVYP